MVTYIGYRGEVQFGLLAGSESTLHEVSAYFLSTFISFLPHSRQYAKALSRRELTHKFNSDDEHPQLVVVRCWFTAFSRC